MRAAAALLLAGSLGYVLTGCGPLGGPDDAWHDLDLIAVAPLVETLDGASADPALATRGEELLGRGVAARRLQSDEKGDEEGDEPDSHAPPLRVGANVRLLEAPPGHALTWRLALGAAPRLLARPLPATGCALRYRIEIAADVGPSTELAARVVPAGGGYFAPAVFDLDLTPWSGERAELRLLAERIKGEGGDEDEDSASSPSTAACRARWAEPRLLSRRPVPPPRGSPRRPNVVLIGLDTTRADHLGAWGRLPSVTPALDALAAEADVWSQAYATFNVTNPSFASIFSGLYGKNHGVYDLRTPLPADRPHLAAVFRDAGWRTGAVVSATHLGPEQSGLGRGFERFVMPWGQYAAETVVHTALEWIESADGPFFVFLHLFDPHTPHTPPAPYAGDLADAARPFVDPILGGAHSLYLGELAYLDRQIGRLLDSLESRGLLETTIVAVVADHGENFGEQGIDFRHAGLWDATVHVPLMLRPPAPPGRVGRRFDGLVQTIDLAPTLLGLAGLDAESFEATDGRDLYTLSDGRTGRRAVFAESADRRGTMVRTHEHLYTRLDDPLVDGDRFLFDLARDPAQRQNLAGTGLAVEAELAELLDRWLRDRREGTVPEAVDLPPEELERLRALGYLD
ncbi:MAG: sulfatase [Acidobacteriota bacterium]